MRFGPTTPILRIFDEAKAKEFYVNLRGFQVDWERPGTGKSLKLRRDASTHVETVPAIF